MELPSLNRQHKTCIDNINDDRHRTDDGYRSRHIDCVGELTRRAVSLCRDAEQQKTAEEEPTERCSDEAQSARLRAMRRRS